MQTVPGATTAAKRGHFRWVICALLFLATTINYMDRQVLGILAAPLQKELGWSEAHYGYIVTAFTAAYAIGQVGVGWFIDRIGTRAGYVVSLTVWSLAAMAHGLARSALQFAIARFALGLGEAGNFPAAVKTVAEWFPKRERALAVGFFNCGSNVGAIVTPLVVPWIAITWGWPWAFYATGAIGFLWIALWLPLYRRPEEHPRLSPAELNYIRSDADPPQAKVPWRRLLAFRATWALVVARFLTDPVWWFYLYWVPKFLYANYGLTLDRIGPPLIAIYLAADAGSIFGGWLSSAMIRRGVPVSRARKLAILVCALMVTPIALAPQVSSVWMAVLLVGMAAAGHQGWAANMFAMISDLYPTRAVSSAAGICGFGGSVGGMLAATATGLILHYTGSYWPLFIWAGGAYLLILGILHAAIPRIEPLRME